MATRTSQTQELASKDLALLDALAGAAADLAARSKDPELGQEDRVALRNHAKLANEQAGILLARGTVVLFSDPPSDAARQIADAISKTEETLAKIQKAKAAIEFVALLVGVAVAVLAGDWNGVFKALGVVTKKVKAFET